MTVESAKAKLDAQEGDPATGYISKADHQDSYDELVDDTALTGATTAEALDVTGALTAGTVASDGTVSGTGLAGGLLSSANPVMDSSAAPGTSAIPSRQDHVHPSDTTKVTGPASATDNALVRFDGTGGKTVQNSGLIVDDSNNLSGVGTINGTDASQLRHTLSAPLNYYWSNGAYRGPITITNTLGRCIFWLINPGAEHTIQSVSLYVPTAAGAGAVWRLGLWEVGTNQAPGTLIADLGTVDPTGTGTKSVEALSVTVPGSLMFMGLALQGVGGGTGGAVWATEITAMPVSSAPMFNSSMATLYANSITGAFASNPTITGNGGIASGYLVPMIQFRRSAS